MQRILLIEDESHVISFITKGLSEKGFEVTAVFDGKSGLQLLKESIFDLIILDIMLPEMNGLEVCKEIRKTDLNVPILILSALGTSENVVMGLETGADDYLVKPFKFIELVARIRTLLRRVNHVTNITANEEQSEYIFKIGDLEVDDYTKTVKRNGEEIQLTSTEYRLLLYLLKNKNRVLSRPDILEEVWGINFDLGSNVVDVYVNYLRKKVDKDVEDKLIHTVIGMGYVLKEN